MTPEQTPSWWNDLTIPPKKLARKRLRYALEQTEDERLRNEALDHIRRIRAGRELESADPFSEQAIPRPVPEETKSTRPKAPFPGDSGPFSLQDPRTPDEFVADVQAGKIQRIDLPERTSAPDETLIKAPETTITRATRKLPETGDTAQIPVVRRGRRNNGAIRRSIPDVEVGIPPELVQGAEHRQEVIPLSPYTGRPLPARPGAAIPRHIPQAPVTTAPPMPSGLPEVPDVPMQGPLHMIPGVIPSQASGQARRGIRSAHNQAAAQAAIPPIPPLPSFVNQGATRNRVPTIPVTQPLPALPGARNRQLAVAGVRAPVLPPLPGMPARANAVRALRNVPPAGPPAQPAQNRAPTIPIRRNPPQAPPQNPVVNVLPAQQQPVQQPRIQHAPIYGVNPGILLLAGMGLVTVNFMGQVLGSANSVNSLADLLLHAPTGKTQGIFSKLPANTLGTLLAETALVLFLALVMGNINSFTNFLATGIIGLFWLIWLIENGDKLATIWKSVTGAIAGITKGGTSKGWTLPSGGF